MLSAKVSDKTPRSKGIIERLITARPFSASTIIAEPVLLYLLDNHPDNKPAAREPINLNISQIHNRAYPNRHVIRHSNKRLD